MIPLIRIETERLILRNFLPNDEKDLFEYLLQRKHELFEPYEDISEDTVERHLKYRLKNDEFIAIELKENHKVIGNIYFGKRDFESREIGYILKGLLITEYTVFMLNEIHVTILQEDS